MVDVDAQGRIGQSIGEYRLLRQLGEGTFGTVYLAEHVHEHTSAAVKVLHAPLVGPNGHRAFLTDVRTVRLRHPHIVSLFDFEFSRDGLPYLAMTYAEGGSLRDRYPQGARLSLETVGNYVQQLASALQYAHDCHVIHHDIKPENILVSSDGTVQLSDFCIARISGQIAPPEPVGTLPYTAPEQIRGEPCPASDQYALAIVVYEWLMGQLPFQGDHRTVVSQHQTDMPPSLSSICPEVSPEVDQVIFKALAKNPKDRYPTITYFAQALHAALQEQALHVVPQEDTVPMPLLPTPGIVEIVPPPAAHADPVSLSADLAESAPSPFAHVSLSGNLVENTSSPIDHVSLSGNLAENTSSPIDHTSLESAPDEGNFLLDDAPAPVKASSLPLPDISIADTEKLPLALSGKERSGGTQGNARPSSPTAPTRIELMPKDKLTPEAFLQKAGRAVFFLWTKQFRHSSAFAKDHLKKLIQRQTSMLHPLVVSSRLPHPHLLPDRRRTLNSFLVICIIGGGFALYLHLFANQPVAPTQKGAVTAISQAVSPSQVTTSTPLPQQQEATPMPTLTPTPSPPPSPVISPAIPAGRLLYSTSHPYAVCDKQGGHWTNTSDASVTCDPDGSKVVNTSGHLVVANLDQLAGDQSPWPRQSFIVQVQVTLNSPSQAAFGIDFLSGADDGYFAYLLSPSGDWTFKYYDAQGNPVNTLISSHLSSSVSTQLTIDIRVEGTSYAFYVNGVDTVGRAFTGAQYIDKIVGLVVAESADITFSNFAVYALS